MKLTTRSRYGTRMLLDLAQHAGEGPVRVIDIAARQGLSVKYLEKLARSLKKAGLIRSVRGAKGGHWLARPASDISMGEIVRALEGDLNIVTCRTERAVCPRLKTCPAHKVWEEVSHALHERLDAMMLDELLASSGPFPAGVENGVALCASGEI